MRLLCVLLLATGLLACGPVDYLHTVAVSASRALARAKTAGAEQMAPYEYWSAVEYLQMARDTASYADYELSSRYGEKAEKMAKAANALALKKREGGAGTKGADETPPDLGKAGKGGGKP